MTTMMTPEIAENIGRQTALKFAPDADSMPITDGGFIVRNPEGNPVSLLDVLQLIYGSIVLTCEPEERSGILKSLFGESNLASPDITQHPAATRAVFHAIIDSQAISCGDERILDIMESYVLLYSQK